MAHSKHADQHEQTWQRVVLLATDRSHSIIGEVADGTTNTIVYSAYGEQSSAQTIATNLGFNGQLRESNIGWYLLGNGYRAYNPRLMRFYSPDNWSPFGEGGLNSYMYCGGEPVMKVDPTGHVFGFLDDALKLVTTAASNARTALSAVKSNLQTGLSASRRALNNHPSMKKIITLEPSFASTQPGVAVPHKLNTALTNFQTRIVTATQSLGTTRADVHTAIQSGSNPVQALTRSLNKQTLLNSVSGQPGNAAIRGRQIKNFFVLHNEPVRPVTPPRPPTPPPPPHRPLTRT